MTPEQEGGNGRNGYPDPLVISPSAKHIHSILLLHGRGGNAAEFSHKFLAAKTSNGKSLKEVFPSVKFIFPTAKKRRSTVRKGAMINQWFDNYSLHDPTQRQELQYEGLRETTEFILQLVRDEEASLAGGLGNVVIGGFSQGCAMALIVALSIPEGDGPSDQVIATDGTNPGTHKQSLGGFIGMSGWLPFAEKIVSAAEPVLRSNDQECDHPLSPEDQTDTMENDDSIYARQLRAANFVRDLVDLGPLQHALEGREKESPSDKTRLYSTPFFVGHGAVDNRVSIRLGVQSKDTLLRLELDVTWKQYERCGHWYKVPDELDDIASFLREKVGLA